MRRVFVLLLTVIILLGTFYAAFVGRSLQAGAGGGQRAALFAAGRPTVTPSPLPLQATPTATPWCVIRSGMDGGRVNLRACGSVSCPVLAVLTEGDALEVIQPGVWVTVRTPDGLTGYVYVRYCQEGK
ncbi:MAG: hypothetical protein DDG60_00790 [Anaerolineae bacterium]|nr:MAG: hypothetical protein DDG60_00790 [Anaerolineae bacterium]